MWVRILQGKATGDVINVCQSEGENLLTTGFAEHAQEPTPPIVEDVTPADVTLAESVVDAGASEPAAVKPKRTRRRKQK